MLATTNIHQYECEDCSNCPVKSECTKSGKNRRVNINENLDNYQKEVIEFLDTEYGIFLRTQRSIQVEGAFGIIKQDMAYRRLNRVGIEGVKLEWNLLCIGFNLKKYHNKLYR